MADFLLFLAKLNLAMGAAIIVVYLLRHPLRALFDAPIAYALWLLVPIAGLANLLPPRAAAPAPAHLTPLQYPAAPMAVIRQIAHPALRIAEQLTGQIALMHPVIAARAAVSDYGMPDHAMLLFASWALGAVLMALYLARLQARFHATMRLGEAGPAVLGFFRPRVVMPYSFQEQFTAPEQSAILAHERVHLARQDARINALTALLRCLCWFNPLIHLGAASLRIDQEFACDATALAGPVSRRDYANALLKSQMTVAALPLGCNWPGSQHPLIERIALLKRKRPGTARRITGTGLVMLVAIFAGLGAWAAEPPLPGKFIAGPHHNNQIALAKSPAMNPAQDQNAGDTGPSQPVADVNSIGSGHHADSLNNVLASKSISAAPSPADAQMPNIGSAEAQAEFAIAGQERPEIRPASGQTPDNASAGQLAHPTSQDAEHKDNLALNAVEVPAKGKATTADAVSGVILVGAAAEEMSANGKGAKGITDSVSTTEALSNGGCEPTIGTVTSVHTDPTLSGTDIVLDHVSPSPMAKTLIGKQGTLIVFIPAENVKPFPALDTHVGHNVAIWGSAAPSIFRIIVTMPRQLRLLSAALADPKKTWCYLSSLQRDM